MEFAKSSELLMDQFIKDFRKVKIKKNAIQQRRLDNVLKIQKLETWDEVELNKSPLLILENKTY